MSTFGNINDATMKALAFALDAVEAEKGHKLEPAHKDARLVKAEDAIKTAIAALTAYRKAQH